MTSKQKLIARITRLLEWAEEGQLKVILEFVRNLLT